MKIREKSIIILIVCCTTVQFAQISIGVLGGINSSTFNGDNPSNGSYSSGYGYNFGGIIDVILFEEISVCLQPMYSRYSTFISYEVGYQYEDYDSILIKTEYTELPINVKIAADNNMTYVTAGIIVTHLVDARVKNQRSGEEVMIEEIFESFNLRANFGVGIKFSIGLPIMFIELNYSQGLTNFTNSTFLDTNSKLKLNGFNLYSGVMLEL